MLLHTTHTRCRTLYTHENFESTTSIMLHVLLERGLCPWYVMIHQNWNFEMPFLELEQKPSNLQLVNSPYCSFFNWFADSGSFLVHQKRGFDCLWEFLKWEKHKNVYRGKVDHSFVKFRRLYICIFKTNQICTCSRRFLQYQIKSHKIWIFWILCGRCKSFQRQWSL